MTFSAGPSFLGTHTVGEIALVLGVALVGVAAIVYLSFRLPARLLLGGALALGVLQFFGPFGFTSLGLLATAAMLPGAAWRFRAPDTPRGNLWPWLLVALAGWQAISVLWADKLGSAAYGVVLSAALLATFLVARETLREGAPSLFTSLTIAAPFVLMQGMLISIFRFFPELELSYLSSITARMLSEPGVEAIAAGGFENVLDENKAGGLLLNANTASLLMAVIACVYAWAALQRPERRTLILFVIVAAISLDASFGTGSKTPILLALVLPMIGILAIIAVRRPLIAAIAAVAGVGAVIGAVTVIATVRPGMLDEALRTMGERDRLWRLALQAFPERWFTGLGFGNWRLHIAENWRITFPGRGPQPFPPHNLFLQAWADAGLIALLLTLALSLIPIAVVLGRIAQRRGDRMIGRGSAELLVVFVGVTWVLGHGMADTTTFLGDNHVLPFFAVLVALALSPRLGASEAPDFAAITPVEESIEPVVASPRRSTLPAARTISRPPRREPPRREPTRP